MMSTKDTLVGTVKKKHHQQHRSAVCCISELVFVKSMPSASGLQSLTKQKALTKQRSLIPFRLWLLQDCQQEHVSSIKNNLPSLSESSDQKLAETNPLDQSHYDITRRIKAVWTLSLLKYRFIARKDHNVPYDWGWDYDSWSLFQPHDSMIYSDL